MKNTYLFELRNQLEAVKDLEGVKFSFICARIKRFIIPIIESFEEASKPSERFIEFETKRTELLEKHAKKNENGEAIKVSIGQNRVQYDIEDTEALEKDVEVLKEEYYDTIKERDEQIDQYNDLLNEDFDLSQLTKLDLEILPKTITLGQLINLRMLIDFDEMQTESMDLTRHEILSFDSNIMPFVENTGLQFNIGMVYNYMQLEPIIREIKTNTAPNDSYVEYRNKIEMLAVSYAKRDENNKLIFDDERGGFLFDSDRVDEMTTKINELNKEYAETIQQYNEKVQENDKYLNETVSVDLCMIDLDNVPEDITAAKMSGIDYLIKA